MVKVMVYPPTSMILADLVDRMGHEALVISKEVRKKVNTAGLDSPPLNMTPEDPKKGLKYAAVDVPSGVRGRMALLGPMIEEANAAIIVMGNNCTLGSCRCGIAPVGCEGFPTECCVFVLFTWVCDTC